MGWRCRFLLFSSNNSLLAKVKRSPFLFLKESFEEVVACSKECMKQRCVAERQDLGWPLWERKRSLPWPLLCPTAAPRAPEVAFWTPAPCRCHSDAVLVPPWRGQSQPHRDQVWDSWQPLKGVIKFDVAGGHLLLWAKWRSSGEKKPFPLLGFIHAQWTVPFWNHRANCRKWPEILVHSIFPMGRETQLFS